MNNKKLQELVENISLEFFDKQFTHQAIFNNRLRTTAGRYLVRSHNLEFSYEYYATFRLEELIGVIKHELCHYHLHLSNKGYSHRDPEFKSLLAKVGGSRYAKATHKKPTPYRYKLVCKKCSFVYYRKRKVNISKYVCGKCGGKLTSEVY